MPAINANDLARLRTTRHATQVALSVYIPAVIWTAAVDGAQSSGARAITVKNVVNTRTPARHFLVRFFDASTDAVLGEARWESYSASTLNVSAHNTPLANGTVIRVYEEIKPQAVHVAIDDDDKVWEDGNIDYTDENTKLIPLARIGCPAVAYRDNSTGIATVYFWSDSVAFGGALSSYAWNFRDGNPSSSTSAGSATSPIAVEYLTAGTRYVSFTVTDSNGKSHTRYIPVFVYDYDGADTPYTDVEILSLDGDVATGGWQCALRVLGDADGDEFPDNALIVLSARDFYGDEEVSIGGQWKYRENIIFTGYIVNGSVKKNYSTGAVEFSAEGIALTLDKDMAEGGYVETGTPGGWHVIPNLTYQLAAHHVLTQHTTVSHIADVNLNLLDYSIEVIDLPEGGLRSQIEQNICKPVRCRIGSSAQGMLYIEPDPQLIPISDRNSMTVVMETEYSDFRGELDFGEELVYKNVSQVDLCAEDGLAEPLFSLAPAVPYPSGKIEQIDGIRADTQTEANNIAGIFDGALNNPFDDVTVPWRGNYRVFDVFPAEPIEISIADNLRGLEWTDQRVWTKRVQYEYRNGILLTTSIVSKDAVPSIGVTGYYPPAPIPVPPTPPPPPPPTPTPTPQPPVPPPPPVPQPLGKGNLIYLSTLRGLAKCTGAYGTDGTDGHPVWTNLSCDIVDGGSTLISQNGVSLFNDGTIDWTTTVSVGDRIVADDDTIDGVVVAIIDDTELTLNNSAFVSNKTFSMYRLKSGLQSANALKIRWFNLDPFSVNMAQTNFTVGWAMTDDGLYKVSGLPDNPIWERKLTIDAARLLVGDNTDGVAFSYRFSPSVLTKDWIGVLVSRGTGFDKYPPGWYSIHHFLVYSTDGGESWQASTSAVCSYGVDLGYAQDYDLIASQHTANRYYTFPRTEHPIRGIDAGATPGDLAMFDGTTPSVVFDLSGIDRTTIYFPYCDGSGNVYTDDSRCYLINRSFSGTRGIYRVDDIFGTPSSTQLTSGDLPNLNWIATHMFDEDYAVVVGDIRVPNGTILFCSNLTDSSPTFTNASHPQMTRGASPLRHFNRPSNMFLVPSDKNLVYFTGGLYAPFGEPGISLPCFTPDFGTTWVDISGYGTSDALDTIMRLRDISDLAYSNIFVDYYYTSGQSGVTAKGLDVSHWQGTMDWNTAAAAGVTFAFIKATEGTGYTDPQFSANWTNAGAAGIQRGVYHYFKNAQDPIAQANHFLDVASSGGELGYAVDCEDESAPLTPENLKMFLDRMETLTGKKCIIYTRASWWNKYIGSQTWTANYTLWVAHWNVSEPTLPTGWTTYGYWQYSASGDGATYGAQSETIDLNRTS